MKIILSLGSVILLSALVFSLYVFIGNTGYTFPVSPQREASVSGLTIIDAAPSSPESTQPAIIKDKQPTVAVFFHNESRVPKDTDGCGLVFPVDRIAPWTEPETVEATASADFALRQLFSGPSTEEKSRGFTSLFSVKTKDSYLGIKIEEGTAYVNLKDIRRLLPSVGSSCGTAELLSEIRETLGSNRQINRVIYALDGKPKTFYDWIRVGCRPENNNCDPTPFR
ncbi:MAG: GerMN domain-containing protein [Patescibacteria group bacterium]